MAFTTTVRESSGITIVDCVGRLVFGNEGFHLRERGRELLKTTKVFVLNFARVSYIDSGGLGVLVGLLTTARASGGDIKLASPSGRAREVLAITHLDSVFEIHPDAEQAAESARRAAA